MRTFLLIWAGQFVSILGTGLGSFAMGVWIFEQTQSATMFALMAALGATVSLLLSPISGLVVDRFDRRWVMILADTGAATMTLLMAYLWFTDSMQVWMIYPILACMVSFSIFQGPALVASVSLLVPRRDLARASGMSQTAAATAGILSPLAAGALIGLIGYHGVVLIDFATFLVGVTILLFVRIPRPPASAVTEGEHRSLWRDALFGWTYLRERRGLFDLVSLFGLNNFGLAFVTVLLTPLILSFASTADLGVVQGAAAFGLLSGGLLLSVWGGPQRRMPALFAAIVFQGLVLLLAGFQPSVALIAFAAALFSFATPFIGGFSQAIFQSKVHLDVQGRVFAMRQVIAVAATPIAYTMAGPLADDVFEPLMAEGGALASSIGRVIGVGDGRGFALLILAVGVMLLVTSALFVLRPRLRRVETELPDVVGGTDDGDAPEPEPAGAPG
jgi:MFS family permease